MEFNSIFSIEKLSRIWLKQISVGVFFACSINGIHSNLRRKKNACSSSNGNVEKNLRMGIFHKSSLDLRKIYEVVHSRWPNHMLDVGLWHSKNAHYGQNQFRCDVCKCWTLIVCLCVYFFFITLSFHLSLFILCHVHLLQLSVPTYEITSWQSTTIRSVWNNKMMRVI